MGQQTEKKRSFFDLKEQFIFYASYHNNPVNVAIHLFCIWQLGMPRIRHVWRLQFNCDVKLKYVIVESHLNLELSFTAGLFVKKCLCPLFNLCISNIIFPTFNLCQKMKLDLAKVSHSHCYAVSSGQGSMLCFSDMHKCTLG
jgi:uncharacterized membrane protein YGL010W